MKSMLKALKIKLLSCLVPVLRTPTVEPLEHSMIQVSSLALASHLSVQIYSFNQQIVMPSFCLQLPQMTHLKPQQHSI